MADTSFIDKLRMNGIFGDGSTPSAPFGMPNLNGGGINASGLVGQIFNYRQKQKEDDRNFAINQRNIQNGLNMGNHVATIDTNISNASNINGGPENLTYKDDALDNYGSDIVNPPFQEQLAKAQLANKYSLDTAKLSQGQQKIDQGQENADTKAYQASIANFKANHPGMRIMSPKGGNETAFDPISGATLDLGIKTGTLTDQDKQNLIGGQKMDQINTEIAGQKDLQNTKGSQALDQIGARIAGNKDVASMNNAAKAANVNPLTAQKVAISKIQTTRPDLAKYLITDPNTHAVSIDPNAPLNVIGEISSIINPKSDVNLPSESSKTSGGTPTSKTPTSVTPTADPLGIR